MRIASNILPWLSVFFVAGCCPAQAPAPVTAADQGAALAQQTPPTYAEQIQARLDEVGIDPSAITCNYRSYWASGLSGDSHRMSVDVVAAMEPNLRRLSERQRTSVEDSLSGSIMNWLIRTVIIHGGNNNLGAFVLPSMTWSDEAGQSHPLVLFHSGFTPDPTHDGSCFRSLIEAG